MNNGISAFVEKMVDSIQNGKAAIFVGAGVSMMPPSKLPSGKELKEIVLESLLTSEFKEDVKLLHSNTLYNEIIPEVLFSEIHFIIQKDIFPVFKILNLALPNEIHRILSKIHTKYSTPIYTTNFDLLIDNFLSKNSVFHLHGHLKDLNGIYIVLKQIIRGVSNQEWIRPMQILKNKDLYVLGYSGNDRDILRLIDNSKIKKIIWLIKPGDKWVLKNTKDILNKKIFYYYGDLKDYSRMIYKLMPAIRKSKLNAGKLKRKNFETKKREILSEYKAGIQKYKIHLSLLRVYYRIGMYKNAEEHGRKVLTDRSLSIEEYCRAVALTADMIRLQPNGYSRALELMNKIENKTEVKTSYAFAEILNCKAIIYLNQAQFNKTSFTYRALYDLNSALEYVEMDKHKFANDVLPNKERYFIIKSFVLHNTGLCYYLLKDFTTAKKYFLKSLRIKRRIAHLNGQISAYKSLSILSYAIKDKKHMYWKQMAFSLIDKYSLPKLNVEYFRELAELMIELGEYQKAEETLHTALNIAETELKGSRHSIEIKKMISKINIKNKKRRLLL